MRDPICPSCHEICEADSVDKSQCCRARLWGDEFERVQLLHYRTPTLKPKRHYSYAHFVATIGLCTFTVAFLITAIVALTLVIGAL